MVKNIPPEQVKQTALSLGGAAAVTAAVNKVSDNQQNNIISKVTENK